MKRKKSVFVCELSTEAAINDCLKAASKTLTTNKNLISAKIKSLSRRKDGQGDMIISELDTINSEYSSAIKVCHGLSAATGEDCSLLDQMQELSKWTFSSSLFKRGLKCACISNLKFAEWSTLTDTTKNRIHKILGDEEGNTFFWLMVNELVQKLLRAISQKKVSRPDYYYCHCSF